MWMNVIWIPTSACLGSVKTPKAPSFVTVKWGIQSRKEPQGAQVKQISSECVTYIGWLPGKINAQVFTHKREIGICIYLCIYERFTSASTCQAFKWTVPSRVSMLEAPYIPNFKDFISTGCVSTHVTAHGSGWRGCSCVGSILSVLLCHMYLEDELASRLKLQGNDHVV